MPQLREGNQTRPYDWDVVSCSRKYKYDINSLILCHHPSRLKLRRKYITTLRARLHRVNTCAGLLDTFCSAISDWFDDGTVDPSKYPTQYHQALHQQSTIGWNHIFQGHLAAAWSAIQIPAGTTADLAKARYMWTTSIVEVSLQWMIDLWETRNKDVHGHTESEQNSRLKAKHQETFRRMLDKKAQMRPSDHWLFPDNPALFLATASANRLGTWIASRRRAVRHSITAAQRDSTHQTPNIVTFFPPTHPEGVARLRRRRHDNLIHDAYCKKRRHKQPSTSRHAQHSIVRFLSLRGRLN